MLQLTIANGKAAGQWIARRLPVRVGRAPDADLSLQEEGVWDWHLEIGLRTSEGFVLTAHPGALVSVNQQTVQEVILHNGDQIGVGAVTMQFGLSPTRHRSSRLREVLTWIVLALLCLGQVALIYLLPG